MKIAAHSKYYIYNSERLTHETDFQNARTKCAYEIRIQTRETLARQQ